MMFGQAGLRAELETTFADRLHIAEPMSAHTSFRIGGPADLWVAAQNIDELCQLCRLARKHEVPCLILGAGSNVLVSDEGIRGLVVENRCQQYTISTNLYAESGASLTVLARQTVRRGLAGLEWALGIPGTIGGAIVNNAGAWGASIADVVREVELLEGDERGQWPVERLEYAYRDSALKRRLRAGQRDFVVLSTTLALMPRPRAELEAAVAMYTAYRQRTQPPGATIGSMFKNPPGDYAGRLIEAAGRKGQQAGRAQISPVHANFFVNLGGATAADVLELIQLARQSVLEKFGVELELEIELIGEYRQVQAGEK
jgi:UDP-N-acetylmuramate dehydrogenase